MHPKNVKLITPGNLEDDLGKLGECDWIIEAVLEDPKIKSDLYKKIDQVRKPGSIISSNTSTIPLAVLTLVALQWLPFTRRATFSQRADATT